MSTANFSFVGRGEPPARPSWLPGPNDGALMTARPTGVELWKSVDLKSWQSLGQVWSGKVRSPKIHFIKGTFYIPYSRDGFGCGLLKSKSGKAEGPYQDLGQITPEGASLSLFEDEDGTVYMALDEGWIAKMKDDLTGVAESPRLMMPRSGSDLGNSPFTVGRKGAFLCKRKGVYYLISAEWTSRTGRPAFDNFVASAKNIYGPYDCRHLMVAHGGETTVFRADGDQWFATMSGNDVQAKFRDRAALVPLEWTKEELYFGRGVQNDFPWKPQHIITERGAWDQCRPLHEYRIRDIHILAHKDGYVYFTGSTIDDRQQDQVLLWRFKADDAAAVGCGKGVVEMKVLMNHKDIPWLDYANRLKYGKSKNSSYSLTRQSMDTSITFAAGTFYVSFNLYNGVGEVAKHPTLDGGKTFTAGSPLIRSKSGTWEGPWESVTKSPHSFCNPYEDEQGRVCTKGWRGIYVLQPDNSFALVKKAEELPPAHYPPQGMTYCDDGSAFAYVGWNDVFQAYYWGSTEWNGTTALHIEQRPGSTYNHTFSWSESGGPEGPYPRCENSLSHCGGAAKFRDSKGRYWSTFFGNDSTAPWFCRMGIIPLKVRQDDRQYLIDIADEWPKD